MQAQEAGTVTRLSYSPEANAATGFRNGPRIADYSQQLADRIGALVDEKRFPLVLGGDCSILLAAPSLCGGAADLGFVSSMGTTISHMRAIRNGVGVTALPGWISLLPPATGRTP